MQACGNSPQKTANNHDKTCKKEEAVQLLCVSASIIMIFAHMLRPATSLFVSKVLAALFNFFVMVLVSQKLGVADRGICAFYYVVIVLALALTDTVVGAALGNLLGRFALRQLLRLSLAWGGIASLLVCAALWAGGKIGSGEACLLLVACWVNGVVSFLQQALLCRHQHAQLSWANLLPALLVACFCTALTGASQLTTTSYLAALCLGWMITALIAFAWINRLPDDRPLVKYSVLFWAGLRLASLNQAAHLLGFINSKLPYFFLSAAALGVFANAQALADAMLMLPGSLGQVLYAHAVQQPAQNRKVPLVSRVLWQNFLAMMVVYAGAVLVPASVYTSLFGPGFEAVKPFLWWLGVGSCFQSGYLIISYWQSAQGHFVRNIYPLVAALLWNAAGCLWLWRSQHFSISNLVLVMVVGQLWAMVVAFWRAFVEPKRRITQPHD
ncbi:MAG: hypothetical protein EAY75_13425 [Bacteroidetes bacterium]|nr:MAG: hypothetical protein EAY75_13425 [Bacteroidota bacterium]